MTGYDFIDPATGTGIGTESSNSSCIPNVYDRCTGLKETRNVDGTCVLNNDCSKECNGGPGKRSQELGLCSCDNEKPIDIVCNQNCRNSSTKVEFKGGNKLGLISQGKLVEVDMTSIGDVFGNFNCSETKFNKCDVKNTEFGSNGKIDGKYGASSIIENSGKRLLSEQHGRNLQTTPVNTASISNPFYCM
jgi:hypothetical protein